MRRRKRPDPVPRHIRFQWLPSNAYRYTDKDFGMLMGVAEITVRKDRELLGLEKYRTDEYFRADVWGVPVRGLTVALSAASPRLITASGLSASIAHANTAQPNTPCTR